MGLDLPLQVLFQFLLAAGLVREQGLGLISEDLPQHHQGYSLVLAYSPALAWRSFRGMLRVSHALIMEAPEEVHVGGPV